MKKIVKNALNNLSDIGYSYEENKRPTQFMIKSLINIFDSRYNELKAASGGYLYPAWRTVVSY